MWALENTATIKKSHTGCSDAGSYTGQDMTRHTNITEKQQQNREKAKTNRAKINTTQNQTRKYPKSNKMSKEGGGAGREGGREGGV